VAKISGTHCCSNRKCVDAEGPVAFALGLSPSPLASFPFPSLSPFFFLGGMLRSRDPRRTRGAMQHRSIPSPCVSENSVRPDPVGFLGRSQKGTQAISKNANPSSSCRVANSKSRKFDKNPDCASCTAAPTASLRAFKNKRISNFGGLPSLDFCECQREAGPTRTQHDASRYSAHVASPTRVFVLEAGSSVRFDPPALILHLASG